MAVAAMETMDHRNLSMRSVTAIGGHFPSPQGGKGFSLPQLPRLRRSSESLSSSWRLTARNASLRMRLSTSFQMAY